jgi:hypothetical protein
MVSAMIDGSTTITLNEPETAPSLSTPKTTDDRPCRDSAASTAPAGGGAIARACYQASARAVCLICKLRWSDHRLNHAGGTGRGRAARGSRSRTKDNDQ